MQPDILTVFFSAYEANIHRSAAQKIMPLLTWASFIISTLTQPESCSRRAIIPKSPDQITQTFT